jgi:hypothetical protein
MNAEYRITETDGGFEPQMLYTAGMGDGQFWTPLLPTGYWAEPSSFSLGRVAARYPLPTKEEAEIAIERAIRINTDRPILESVRDAATETLDD